MSKLLAQSLTINNQTVTGPLVGINTIGDVVTKVLELLIPAAGIILLFVLIWGGYDFMMSQGNAEKVKGAQAKITTGLIGFVLLVFSYLIVRLVTNIFGIDTGGLF